MKSLKEAFKTAGFDDEDLIVKWTGRYYFKNDQFLKEVEDNSCADVIIKLNPNNTVCAACYAMRYKYFKEFVNNIDFVEMEAKYGIEDLLMRYVNKLKQQGVVIRYLDSLQLVCNVFGLGTKMEVIHL